MTKSKQSSQLRLLMGLVALGVLPFYLAEVSAGLRAPYWMGNRPLEWFASIAPTFIYWVIGVAITLFVYAVLQTQPKAHRSESDTSRVVLSIPHLFAVLAASAILNFGLAENLHASVQRELEVGFHASLAIICLAWGMHRLNIFSTGPAIVGGIGAVLGAAHSLQVSASTMVIRTFGVDLAQQISFRHAAVAFGLAMIASVVGSRHRQWGMRIAAALLVGSLAYPLYAESRAQRRADASENVGPNVLLITADTMRLDYASVYGGDTPTPVLEALAQTGAKFEQAISLAPWTVPSFNGMFSSQFPPSVDASLDDDVRDAQLSLYGRIGKYWLGKDQKSIARKLRDRDYDASAFIGNFAMRKEKWLLGDFTTYLVVLPLLETRDGPLSRSRFFSTALHSVWPSLYLDRPFDNTRAVTEYTQSFIRYRKRERFFFWAHYFDPHTPYDPPAEFRTRTGPFPFMPQRTNWSVFKEKDYIRSLYAGEIAYVDHEVGKVLDTLESTGIAEQTYVVFSSDHGEEFWEHDRFGHGHSMYDELIHVPLIMTGPGIPPQTVSKTVSMIDFLPTLADWTNVPADPSWRGKSWSESLENAAFDNALAPVFSQATGVLPPPPEPLQSVILGNNKLIRGLESGSFSLFNRASDPGEQNDIAAERPKLAARLLGELNTWTRSFPATFGAFGATGEMPQPDLETLDNLKALGYLPDDAP